MSHPAPPSSPRDRAFRRYLGLTLLGALLPGSAFIATGRRRLGAAVLGATVLAVVTVLVVVLVRGPRQIGLELALRPDAMRGIGVALIVVAVLWVTVMVASQRSLEPRSLALWQRLVGTGLVVVLCSLVAAPLAVASQAAFTTRDVVQQVFPDIDFVEGRDPGSLTTPTVVEEAVDPWPDKDRINVLLLGSDWNNERAGNGLRTDTMIVASIDKESGKTVLFSLPRNLQHTPFPKGPFRKAYPDGFYDPDNPDEGLLNELYQRVPEDHPELFPPSTRRPGVDALKLAIGEALGLTIDYYVMVNLAGFRAAIDALGGVYVNVRYPIPINSKTLPGGGCTTPEGYLSPGQDKLLDGQEALWFARARCGYGELADGDNDRMRRQRCVVGAIVDRMTPEQLLLRYQALAAEAKRIVSTDIPQSLLQGFVTLGEKVSRTEVTSLAFTGTTLRGTNGRPDFDTIQRLVQRAIKAPAKVKPVEPAETPAASPSSSASKKASPRPPASATTSATRGEQTGTAEALSAVC